MIYRTTRNKTIVAAVLALSISACGVLKGGEAESSSFLPFDDELVEMRERAPFHGIWYRDRAEFALLKQKYHKLVILPVNTHPVEETLSRHRFLGKDAIAERIEEAREMARYMRQKFIAAIRADKEHQIAVVDTVTPDTFVLEIALVDIVPTNGVVNFASTTASFFVPGTGTLKYLGTGSIAIEGILREGATGRPLVAFKDREVDKTTPFTVRDFQQYAHIREAIEEWAEQFAELARTPLTHRVEDSSPFSLSLY
ncbi:DUF3313 domain-containing protein [bacterium]|nr:DUF3313 domain-containing protein [bacterium]